VKGGSKKMKNSGVRIDEVRMENRGICLGAFKSSVDIVLQTDFLRGLVMHSARSPTEEIFNREEDRFSTEKSSREVCLKEPSTIPLLKDPGCLSLERYTQFPIEDRVPCDVCMQSSLFLKTKPP
jgi:hypothetical protein